jgi:hypothetical protein
VTRPLSWWWKASAPTRKWTSADGETTDDDVLDASASERFGREPQRVEDLGRDDVAEEARVGLGHASPAGSGDAEVRAG